MNPELRIELDAASGVTVLTIDRPRTANAIDPALSRAVCGALHAAQTDKAQRAVVLTGAGERAFCAGADLGNPGKLLPQALAEQRAVALSAVLDAMLDFDKPLVVAANGAAVGAGAMLALLADRLVMAEGTRLVFPEIDVGTPTLLGLAIVTDLAGSALAADLVQSGRAMPAEEACARGLATVVPRSELDRAAREAAAALAAKPQMAFATNKAWIQDRRREALVRARAETRRTRAQVLGATA